MDLQPVYYEKQEFVETATGNKVNKKSRLFGSQNIVLNGKVSKIYLFSNFLFCLSLISRIFFYSFFFSQFS